MITAQKTYVCGFYGARDGYEVPAALQEAGLLEVLLTDLYGDHRWVAKRWRPKAARQHALLPHEKVRGSVTLLLAKQMAGRLFADPERCNLWPDALLSRWVAREARRREAHIFTYEPYAVPRPRGGFPRGGKQVVFYYHPHVDTEDAVYQEDEKRWPKFHEHSGLLSSPWRRRTADAWKHADLVLCASSFTKHSLVAAGMEERRIVVVPYGTSMERGAGSMEREAETALQLEELTLRPGSLTGWKRGRREVGESLLATGNSVAFGPSRKGSVHSAKSLRLLFVGRNPLRKGLHHLLMAWNAASKRPGDLLTIVCAAKPLEMQRLVEGRDDVRWLDSLSGEELARSYRDADALVVPSLCEGFGHVYLEAMGHGCAVVGTRNSALPDIGDELQGVFTVGVGDVDGLARLISAASADPSIFRRVRVAAKEQATRFTWERFRSGLAAAVGAGR